MKQMLYYCGKCRRKGVAVEENGACPECGTEMSVTGEEIPHESSKVLISKVIGNKNRWVESFMESQLQCSCGSMTRYGRDNGGMWQFLWCPECGLAVAGKSIVEILKKWRIAKIQRKKGSERNEILN